MGCRGHFDNNPPMQLSVYCTLLCSIITIYIIVTQVTNRADLGSTRIFSIREYSVFTENSAQKILLCGLLTP